MCRPCSLGDRTREATCAWRPRHLPLARALRDLPLRPSPVTPSRQVVPARSSLPSVRLLPLFRVGHPLQWIARAPAGRGAANAARVGSLCERPDKPTLMTRTCCIVACHPVHARAWPATQRILREVFVPRSGCTSSGRASWLCMFDNTVSLHFAPSTLLRQSRPPTSRDRIGRRASWFRMSNTRGKSCIVFADACPGKFVSACHRLQTLHCHGVPASAYLFAHSRHTRSASLRFHCPAVNALAGFRSAQAPHVRSSQYLANNAFQSMRSPRSCRSSRSRPKPIPFWNGAASKAR